jgi:curli biogenesis system outer membrane secretion channel CsgG
MFATISNSWFTKSTLFLVALATIIPTGVMAQTRKKEKATPTSIQSPYRMAVMPFKLSDSPLAMQGGQAFSLALADQMSSELDKRGATLIETTERDEIYREIDQQFTGYADSETSVALGGHLGAQWIVVGRVTQLGSETKAFEIGPIRSTTHTVTASLDVRIVHAATGIRLASATGSASQKKEDVSIRGIPFGSWLSNMDFSSSEWRNSIAGKTIGAALADAAEKLAVACPDAVSKSKRYDQQAHEAANPPAPAISRTAMGSLTYMVIVPETVMVPQPVVDPAAETEFLRQLTNLGLKVVDPTRMRELLIDQAMLAELRGSITEATAYELRSKYGADILIVGEAMAGRFDRQNANLDTIGSRARVEVRAIGLDNAQILTADGHQESGRDMNDVMAAKEALRRAAKKLAPKIIGGISNALVRDGLIQGFEERDRKLEFAVEGITSNAQAKAICEAIERIGGISKVERNMLSGNLFSGIIHYSPKQIKHLADVLTENIPLARLGIEITGYTERSVTAKVRKVQPKPVPSPKRKGVRG